MLIGALIVMAAMMFTFFIEWMSPLTRDIAVWFVAALAGAHLYSVVDVVASSR
jgi:hypothetical protein